MNETFRLWDSQEKNVIEVEAKKVGKEWKALCPKHDDKIKSLSINKEKEVYNCFGCPFEGHLYNPTKDLTRKPKKKAQEESIPINYKIMEKRVKEYQDIIPMGVKKARGLTYDIIEKFQLGFCQSHPIWPAHKNSITIPIKKDKKIVNIRYHTIEKHTDPKILPYESGLKYATWLYPESELENDTLIFTEGELDALCCISHGLPAITRTCGALVWKPEFSNYFKHKTVYICQDCDKAGREGAQKIAQELIEVVKEVKIVDLGLKKEGEDLTDWFVTYKKSKEELLKLIKSTFAYIPQSLPRSKTLKEKEKSKEKKVREQSKKNFRASLYAKKILEKYKVIYDDHKRLWWYNDSQGIWKDNFETLCRSILRKGLLASFDTIYFENETIEAIKDLSYQQQIPSEPNRHLIPFNNGIYDMSEDKLKPFDSSHFFINKLGVNFNPEQRQYPSIDKLFNEIVGKRDVVTLYEIIAYIMYRGYPYPKCFFLYGNGANGKSTYCQVLRRIIGNENISSTSLETLQYNRFGTSALYGKLVNISPEISYNVLKKTDKLKQLTGIDLVRGEKKFKDEFLFVNYAKLIFIGNEIPYSEDKSFAFYRRMLLIPFPKRFEIKRKADPFIIEKIPAGEFEAVGFECIQILKELERNLFTFTRHKRTKQVEQEYERVSDPIGMFIKEKIEDDQEGNIPVKDFNQELKTYQEEKELRVWTDEQISRVMKQKGYTKRTLRIATNTEGTYRFYKAYLDVNWKILDKNENA